MLIPVRCFTCGKPVSEYWDEYKTRLSKGEPVKKILDELGFDRICCRRMFVSQEDLIDEILPYKRF